MVDGARDSFNQLEGSVVSRSGGAQPRSSATIDVMVMVTLMLVKMYRHKPNFEATTALDRQSSTSPKIRELVWSRFANTPVGAEIGFMYEYCVVQHLQRMPH